MMKNKGGMVVQESFREMKTLCPIAASNLLNVRSGNFCKHYAAAHLASSLETTPIFALTTGKMMNNLILEHNICFIMPVREHFYMCQKTFSLKDFSNHWIENVLAH